MTRLRTAVALIGLLLCSPITAKADPVLDWNATAIATMLSQPTPPGVPSPFAQARFMSITQLAVFEAVNAIEGRYEPYLGTVVAPAGASAEAAAVAAAYNVLKNYFPASAGPLLTAYNTSLAAIPAGEARDNGVATGEAAAAQMIARRVGDGSSPATNYLPTSTAVGVWQLTPSCPVLGGVNFQWQNITPFGVPSVAGSTAWIEPFALAPPPALTSKKYEKDFNEVKRVGNVTSSLADRPQDRADVARFYAASSPAYIFNLVGRQLATAKGSSLSENARTFALLNVASNDALIASFWTKYHEQLWRPETAIRDPRSDDINPKTASDPDFKPYILTPCFPSYPSNHGSGSNSAAEILRRVFGAGGHSIDMANAAVPGITFRYTKIKQITDDISDARVFGGIHYRFDQEAGANLGHDIAKYVYKHNLRRAKHSGGGDDEDENEDED